MKKAEALITDKNKTLVKKSLFFRAYERVNYELSVFIFFVIFYLPQNYKITDDVYSMLHVFDYSIGFAPRLFIGSVMSLFTDYKSESFQTIFFGVIFIVDAVLFAFIAGRIIRKASEEMKEITVFLVTLFLAVPYSLAVIYPRTLSVDRVNVLFTLLALIFLNRRIWKWFVPVLLFLALATYQQYAFMYMPIVAILLIYEVFRNIYSKQSIILCVVGYVTMAAGSAYFYLFGGLKSFKDANELIAFGSDKTDIPLTWLQIDGLLFKDPLDFFKNCELPSFSFKSGFTNEFIALLYLLPLLFIFFFIWKNAIKNSAGKFEKFTFILCALAPLSRLPMFILSTNFIKARVAMIVVQFFLVFYFLYTGNTAVIISIKKIGDFFKKNFLLYLLMIAYFAMLFLAFRKSVFWIILETALRGKL